MLAGASALPGTTAVCLPGDAVTEQEWLAGADPLGMLSFLGEMVSIRKVRLMACAEWRRVTGRSADEKALRIVRFAEQFADGAVSRKRVLKAIANETNDFKKRFDGECNPACVAGFSEACHTSSLCVHPRLFDSLRWKMHPSNPLRFGYPKLMYDLFGNPFRPVTIVPSWLAWNDGAIRKMAAAIYEERAFDHLPILADALEDAGCHNADILTHCRQPGKHVRGCWAVDLVLGKE
jgi:hypothetical protein